MYFKPGSVEALMPKRSSRNSDADLQRTENRSKVTEQVRAAASVTMVRKRMNHLGNTENSGFNLNLTLAIP